jgi:hypothetical protein
MQSNTEPPVHSTPEAQDAGGFIFCSTTGCGIVIGNGRFGAKAPRPCNRCQWAARNSGPTKGFPEYRP